MFRKEVKSIRELVMRNLRMNGLETPLLQRRLIEAWPVVAGAVIARYTLDTYIQNQTLVVRLSNPALRADMNMRRREFIDKLNHKVGSQVIVDIKFL